MAFKIILTLNFSTGRTAADTSLDLTQQLLAANALYKSLLANAQNLQNLQSLHTSQQLQASNAAGLSLPQLQVLSSTEQSSPALANGQIDAGSGGTSGNTAGLAPGTLAVIAALQGRGLLPASCLSGDQAALAAALQLRMLSQVSFPEASTAAGGGLERQLAMLHGGHASGGHGAGSLCGSAGGGLQLPPISLHGLHARASGADEAGRPQNLGGAGPGHDGVASGESVAGLLAALAAAARAVQATPRSAAPEQEPGAGALVVSG